MAVGRFARAQSLAGRLIAKNGERSTLVRVTDGTPPVLTKPWEPGAPTTTSYTVDAVWTEVSLRRVDGTLIKAGDEQVLIPAKGLAVVPSPTTDLMVRINGSRWQIVKVDTIQPNEDLILHSLVCRGLG